MKFISGYIMATIANYSLRKINQPLTPSSFFKFNDDTQMSHEDVLELMEKPEIKYRFKKNGR